MTQAVPIRRQAGTVPPPPAQAERKRVAFGKIATATGHRILVYGPGWLSSACHPALRPS